MISGYHKVCAMNTQPALSDLSIVHKTGMKILFYKLGVNLCLLVANFLIVTMENYSKIFYSAPMRRICCSAEQCKLPRFFYLLTFFELPGNRNMTQHRVIPELSLEIGSISERIKILQVNAFSSKANHSFLKQ